MREREIRVLRDTLKTLESMQDYMDVTNAALRALIAYGHEDYVPCEKEKAAYEAERKSYGTIANIVGADGINREPKSWWENKV